MDLLGAIREEAEGGRSPPPVGARRAADGEPAGGTHVDDPFSVERASAAAWDRWNQLMAACLADDERAHRLAGRCALGQSDLARACSLEALLRERDPGAMVFFGSVEVFGQLGPLGCAEGEAQAKEVEKEGAEPGPAVLVLRPNFRERVQLIPPELLVLLVSLV